MTGARGWRTGVVVGLVAVGVGTGLMLQSAGSDGSEEQRLLEMETIERLAGTADVVNIIIDDE